MYNRTRKALDRAFREGTIFEEDGVSIDTREVFDIVVDSVLGQLTIKEEEIDKIEIIEEIKKETKDAAEYVQDKMACNLE